MVEGLTEQVSFTSSKIRGDRDVSRLENGLSAIEGVRDVEVNADAHTVRIVFDPVVTSATKLQAEVESLGYAIDSQEDSRQE